MSNEIIMLYGQIFHMFLVPFSWNLVFLDATFSQYKKATNITGVVSLRFDDSVDICELNVDSQINIG